MSSLINTTLSLIAHAISHMLRFRDDYVRRNWRTTKGCGNSGGGFIFDTHSIHKVIVNVSTSSSRLSGNTLWCSSAICVDLRVSPCRWILMSSSSFSFGNFNHLSFGLILLHGSGKCAVSSKLNLGLPCPSGDQYFVNQTL